MFAVGYVALDLNALYALRANQNTGLYLQSAIDFVRTGSTFDQPDGRAHLLVHDQWLVYAVLAPLVALWPRPEAAIVVQVAALAAAAIPLRAFARACGARAGDATLLAIAFLISPSMQGFAYDGFVGEDLLPVVAFSLALALRRRSLRWSLVCAQLALGIKEDEAWFLAWFGALLAFGVFTTHARLERRDRRADRTIGFAVAALALVNGLTYYAIASHFGYAPEHPRYGLIDTQWPQQLDFLLEMLVPFAFAPLRLGWRVLAAAPFFAELFFAQDRTYPLYHIGAYYTVPLVACAALATAAHVRRAPQLARYALAGSIFMALFFDNASVVHLGRRPFSGDPQYARARAWATTSAAVDFPCQDVGAWTVASPDLNARLVGCGAPSARAPRPAWRDVPLGASAPWTRGPRPAR
ncbi:MAG: hypothetical protein NVS2B3_15010 [Vulcanimicrobiaceae bacterium]